MKMFPFSLSRLSRVQYSIATIEGPSQPKDCAVTHGRSERIGLNSISSIVRSQSFLKTKRIWDTVTVMIIFLF